MGTGEVMPISVPAQLGGEAAHEVIHRLVLIQLGDGRQHTVGVCGEEDHRLGHALDLPDSSALLMYSTG